ncbi:MAG TPA: hypothetical protein VN691_12225, partial [Steroidobacteraceae bacterium]|nr:hypothetical protein [Steroidobacteraceae bacterium]
SALRIARSTCEHVQASAVMVISQTRIRRRNARETVAAGVVLLVFGFYAWVLPGWMIETAACW